MQNINRLDQELAGVAMTGVAAFERRRALIQTLQAAPVVRVQPPPESIDALAETLTTVVPSLGLLPVQRRQLAIDLNLALNSGNLSPTQAERVITDARTLLQMRFAANPRGIETLIGELGSIVGEVQGRLVQASGPPDQPVVTARPEQAPVGQSASTQAGQGSGASAPAATNAPPR